MMFRDWKETVRAIYDELHFGRDSIFGGGDGRNLARRLVTMIEERHPDYFVDAPRGGSARRKRSGEMNDELEKRGRCIRAFERKYGRSNPESLRIDIADGNFVRVARGRVWADFDISAWRVRMTDFGVLTEDRP